MSGRRGFVELCGVLLLAMAVPAGAQVADEASKYWPHWRGPHRDGLATTDVPLHFSATDNVKWKVPIPGRGFSTPIVWGNRVFLTTAIALDDPTRAERGRRMPLVTQRLSLMCFDRRTGEVVWERIAAEVMPHERYHRALSSYANQSPVTDGEHVYAFFGSFGLYAYDFDGNLQWSRDFNVKMKIFNQFGESSSPALHGNTLVMLFDHDGQSFIEAVDKRTGETLWKRLRDEETGWTSPYIVEHDGQPQVITTGGNYVRSNDLATGKELWRCAGMIRHPIPMPVVKHGLVYAVSAVQERRIRVIRLGRTGDLTGTDAIVWQLDRAASYNPSPLVWGDELYLVRDGGLSSRTSRLSAFVAKTGKPHYVQARLPSPYTIKASPVGVGNKIYLLSEEGDVIVVKRGPNFEVLAVNPMEEMLLASPAIADGELFLRGVDHLFAISES